MVGHISAECFIALYLLNFTKKLVHNTGIIDLPKGIAPSKEKQERNKKKGDKKGSRS